VPVIDKLYDVCVVGICDLTFYYASLLLFILLFVQKKLCWFAAKQLGFHYADEVGGYYM